MTNATIDFKANIELCEVHTSKSMRKRSTEKSEEHYVSQQKSSFDKKHLYTLHLQFAHYVCTSYRVSVKACQEIYTFLYLHELD